VVMLDGLGGDQCLGLGVVGFHIDVLWCIGTAAMAGVFLGLRLILLYCLLKFIYSGVERAQWVSYICYGYRYVISITVIRNYILLYDIVWLYFYLYVCVHGGTDLNILLQSVLGYR
jgi:hypothetical protein